MKVYRTDEIRNVVLLGHGGSGKTSLAEAMAYVSGATSRMGKIADGNTISDFDKEEQKREFSISTSLIPIEWEKAKINILDTPGYFDFVGEVEEAVSAADAAVIVVSGKAGVEVGTEKAWELCDKYKLPRMVYVTEMDVDDASFRQVVQDLTERYGKVIAPHFQPIRENEKLVGYVNVIKNAARRYTGVGQREECEIPEYCKPNLEIYRDKLLEAVAETSEAFMERYFEGDEFSVEEIRSAMRTEVMDGDIVPVAMGSNIQAQGVANLLSDIVRFFPSPDSRSCAGINRKTNEIFEGNYDFAKAKSAYVFKTMVDPFIGKYSFVKVCSGVLKGDDILYNGDSDAEAKLGKIYTMVGNKPTEVSELFAGDIGAIAKLANTKTGDTLSTKNTPVMYGKTEYSKPYTYMKYVCNNKGDEDKVSQALQKMMAEDVTLKTVNDSENRQTLLYGMGDQHLEITASKLAARYKCEIRLETPKVAFRETIKKKSDVDSKYKKQSGGHGQYGHVKMRFEASGDLETPYVFEEEVVGGAVPKNYFPAVEKGLQEAVVKGPLAGYPVVGVKAVLYDGSYHPVDSSEMAFKTATVQAFKKGFMEASPVLLEPIASLTVTIPDDYTGDVMGDLNKRRGRVLGMNPVSGGRQEIVADIPMTGLFGYCTVLRSMTGGRGVYSYEFARYEQAPSDVQEAEIAKRAKEE
ncbi:elongation factor G [Dorea longicatena]|uniref:elongation factor G n=1 Tax=Dorea longicatena TaxID=88431 RepID=UPI000E4E956A|nr:elongation factor G [Dorea longicatena]MCB6954630.1 elongation factor G [Dorea longicatena]MCG4678500.1 elongation factor G [Dorea longicatena]RGU06987.1 elongation factor G [Dorea longicatena]